MDTLQAFRRFGYYAIGYKAAQEIIARGYPRDMIFDANLSQLS